MSGIAPGKDRILGGLVFTHTISGEDKLVISPFNGRGSRIEHPSVRATLDYVMKNLIPGQRVDLSDDYGIILSLKTVPEVSQSAYKELVKKRDKDLGYLLKALGLEIVIPQYAPEAKSK